MKPILDPGTSNVSERTFPKKQFRIGAVLSLLCIASVGCREKTESQVLNASPESSIFADRNQVKPPNIAPDDLRKQIGSLYEDDTWRLKSFTGLLESGWKATRAYQRDRREHMEPIELGQPLGEKELSEFIKNQESFQDKLAMLAMWRSKAKEPSAYDVPESALRKDEKALRELRQLADKAFPALLYDLQIPVNQAVVISDGLPKLRSDADIFLKAYSRICEHPPAAPFGAGHIIDFSPGTAFKSAADGNGDSQASLRAQIDAAFRYHSPWIR